MQEVASSPNDTVRDVSLIGNGIELVLDLPDPAVAPAWRSYVVEFTETAGWAFEPNINRAPTREEFIAVLQHLSALRIDADFRNGADTVRLKNVVLTGNRCGLPGDVNGDGAVDGADVQAFVTALLAGTSGNAGYCAADTNQDGIVDAGDVPAFVSRLLGT